MKKYGTAVKINNSTRKENQKQTSKNKNKKSKTLAPHAPSFHIL